LQALHPLEVATVGGSEHATTLDHTYASPGSRPDTPPTTLLRWFRPPLSTLPAFALGPSGRWTWCLQRTALLRGLLGL